MPLSAADLRHRALRRDEPPALRHAGVRGRPGRRLPHGIRGLQVVALLRGGVRQHDRRLGRLHAAVPGRLEPDAVDPLRRAPRGLASGSALDHPIVAGVLSIAIFVGKVFLAIFFFMWVRWTVPRFRYDQVMRIGWQQLLPLSIANLLAYTVGIAFLQG